MAALIFHKAQAEKTRREKLNGIEYLIVPTISIVEGVLNEELVLADEIGAHFEAWNGRPVVMAHPEQDGVFISANDPETLGEFAFGRIFNTDFDGEKLRQEMWIPLQEAIDRGGDFKDAVERFEANKKTDVSTAYLRDAEETSGTFKGRGYNTIARNIRPDHLAVLLHEPGACSIEDGCGAPRVNCSARNRADCANARWAQNHEHDSAVIMLVVAPDVANRLSVEGGEPASEMHLTLAYLGKKNDLEVDRGDIESAVQETAKEGSLISGRLGGVGRFCDLDVEGKHAVYASFDAVELASFRQKLVERLASSGVGVDEGHGFTPHITLAYIDKNAETPVPTIEPEDLSFDTLYLAIGDDVTGYELGSGKIRDNVDLMTNPFPNEHAARIKEPGQFDSIRRSNDELGEGVDAIFGIKGDASEIQAIRFDKAQFTPAEAREWLSDHDFKAIEFEEATEVSKNVKPNVLERAKSAVMVIAEALHLNINLEVNMDELKAQIVADGRFGFSVDDVSGLSESALSKLVKFLDDNPAAEQEDVEEEIEDILDEEEEVEDMAGEEHDDDDDKKKKREHPLAFNAQAPCDQFAEFGGPEKALETLKAHQDGEVKRKTELVAALVANEACLLSSEQMTEMSIPTLEAMQKSFTPADYSGQGGGVSMQVNKSVEPYSQPSMF